MYHRQSLLPLLFSVVLFLSTTLCSLAAAPDETREKTPLSIAGLRLGDDINAYNDFIQPNFLKETVVTDWHGFRKGVISSGVCRYPDQILKIDMKYEERSRKFFEKLLARFKDQFGEPDGWHGDSFGVMHIWKWHFTDKDNNPVSLTLQFNGKNSNETIGNMLKLSYPEKIEEERECLVSMCNRRMENVSEQKREDLKKTDWSYLIPR